MVAAEVREGLARRRAAGASFEAAWRAATRTAPARAVPGVERSGWARALDETRPAWRSAYLLEPAEPAVAAAGAVRELHEAEAGDVLALVAR